MMRYNQDTDEFEPLDMREFAEEMERRHKVIKTSTNPDEVFAAGGDFLEMLEAGKRAKDRNAA